MSFLYTNFAESVLIADLASDGLEVQIVASEADEFAQPSGGDVQRLYIRDDTGEYEFIDLVSNPLSGTFTITRAKESTAARTWPAGAKIAGIFSAEVLEQLAGAASDASASADDAATAQAAAEAAATTAQGYASDAANSAAAAQTSAEEAALAAGQSAEYSGRTNSSLVLNPVFNDYATGFTLPTNWSNGVNGTGSRQAGSVGQYAHRMMGGAGSDAWMKQSSRPAGVGPFYVEFTTELLSGTYAGLGVQILAYDAGPTLLQTFDKIATAIPDTNGEVSSTKGGLRHFRPAPITFPVNTVSFEIRAYTHNSDYGSTSVSNLVEWHQVDLHPSAYTDLVADANASAIVLEQTVRATADDTFASNLASETSSRTTADATLQSHIDSEASTRATGDSTNASNLTSLSSTVSGHTSSIATLSSTMASIQGNLLATWGVQLDVDGKVSGIASLNDGSTSSMSFLQDTFLIFDGVSDVPLFSASAGKVTINGDLAVGGSIKVGATRLKVALESLRLGAADGASFTWLPGGDDLGTIPEYLLDNTNLAPLSTGEQYSLSLTSLSTTGGVVSARINTPGTTAGVTCSTSASGSTGEPAKKIIKSDAADAYDHNYVFNVTAYWIATSIFTGDIPGLPYETNGAVVFTFYYDSGGGWTSCGTLYYNPSTHNSTSQTGNHVAYTFTKNVSISAAIGHSGSYSFGVSADSGGGITTFTSVTYTKQTASGDRTASPNGEQLKITAFPRNA
jgi:hypothetical protein